MFLLITIGSVQLSSRVFAGERGYNCTSDANSSITCVETNCQQGPLAVRCPAYQEMVTMECSNSKDSGSTTAGIAILVLISLALGVGWIVTSIVVWRKSVSKVK